ncbi:hypothetical protein LEP1GSC133_1199 [Leptospira borgpetersenii serovar Pomona str. 200901868]|uniref:Uncharacterized protein n=1 Tax=Leptospira borgpetersenii serovar Pomona str. 200901868 TaxID=1192866 RepID=M6VVR4_LEPBO|nr:hypothetical protein LEP1GSC133_1199 [Leptospira borgpetersenii serovar Pomona str. 200901868]UPO14491.1 hypothetical protein MY480_10325 [Leptospira borgpetersenii]
MDEGIKFKRTIKGFQVLGILTKTVGYQIGFRKKIPKIDTIKPATKSV